MAGRRGRRGPRGGARRRVGVPGHGRRRGSLQRGDQVDGQPAGLPAGVRIEADDPAGYEDGTLGWVVDQPTFFFPDGSAMRTRLTSVLRHEDGSWKVVHMHVSVGVPDEEVAELQHRWSGSP